MKKNTRRTLAAVVMAVGLVVGSGAAANAGTSHVPPGDGTGGGVWRCFQLTPWSPVQCIRVW